MGALNLNILPKLRGNVGKFSEVMGKYRMLHENLAKLHSSCLSSYNCVHMNMEAVLYGGLRVPVLCRTCCIIQIWGRTQA